MPKCGRLRFSGPDKLHHRDKVACVTCGNVCTADEAIEAGRRAAKVEKLDPE